MCGDLMVNNWQMDRIVCIILWCLLRWSTTATYELNDLLTNGDGTGTYTQIRSELRWMWRQRAAEFFFYKRIIYATASYVRFRVFSVYRTRKRKKVVGLPPRSRGGRTVANIRHGGQSRVQYDNITWINHRVIIINTRTESVPNIEL